MNDEGRAIMWRYMNIVRPFREASAAGWWNTYAGPREVRLDAQGRMLVRPADALEKLRGEKVALEQLRAASSEIRLAFPAAAKGVTGIRLGDGRLALEARYDHAAQQVQLDLRGMAAKPDASTLEDRDDGSGSRLSVKRAEVLSAPLPVPAGETVTLRFFSDHSVFELYANDELVISAVGFFSEPEKLKARLISPGVAADVEAWEMKPLQWSSAAR